MFFERRTEALKASAIPSGAGRAAVLGFSFGSLDRPAICEVGTR